MLKMLVYWADAYKNALVVASKEFRLEIEPDKTKCMIMSRDPITGQNHSMNTDNTSFERVEHFKYFGTTLTDQNSIQEEIKSRLNSGMLAVIQCSTSCLPVCYPKV
jgi:hypothetical protein